MPFLVHRVIALPTISEVRDELIAYTAQLLYNPRAESQHGSG